MSIVDHVSQSVSVLDISVASGNAEQWKKVIQVPLRPGRMKEFVALCCPDHSIDTVVGSSQFKNNVLAVKISVMNAHHMNNIEHPIAPGLSTRQLLTYTRFTGSNSCISSTNAQFLQHKPADYYERFCLCFNTHLPIARREVSYLKSSVTDHPTILHTLSLQKEASKASHMPEPRKKSIFEMKRRSSNRRTKRSQARHLIVSLRVPSEALLALSRAQPGLATLPREIRDLVYEHLVTSPSPIKVCYDHDGLSAFIRLFENGERGVAAAFLCETVRGSSLAPEVYEVFFKNNTFECVDCKMLEQFISSGHTKFGVRMNKGSELTTATQASENALRADLHRPMKRYELQFDKRPWLRNFKVKLHCDFRESNYVEQLGLILALPHLQHLDIFIQGLCNKEGYINMVDLTIGEIATLCTEIREKIGSGLSVQVLKNWHDFCSSPVYHYINESPSMNWLDVSWMWEAPSTEICAEFEMTMAAHREHMQAMVATGDLLQSSQLRVFGKHWIRYHMEMVALANRNAEVIVLD